MNINHFTDGIDDTPFHSSGYAKAANGNVIGAVSPQSFNQRLHVERNRQRVRKYHDSMIANGHQRHAQFHRVDVVNSAPMRSVDSHSQETPTPRGVTPPIQRTGTGRSISGFTRPATRPGFSEPPARGFNPYK